MTKLEVKKFGDSLFLLNNTNRYVVNYEIKEKSDLVVAYRLLNSTNYDMVLSDADYTLNLMQGSTEIRIVNEELLKGIHSFKLIMGLEPVDFSTGSISQRLQFLEDKVEDYVLFVDGVDEPTTLPPLKTGETWVRTDTGYRAFNVEVNEGIKVFVTQNNHGFIFDPVCYNGVTKKYELATTATGADGMAVKINENDFFFVSDGMMALPSGAVDVNGAAIVEDEYYFLSENVAGKVSKIKPQYFFQSLFSVVKKEGHLIALISIDNPIDLVPKDFSDLGLVTENQITRAYKTIAELQNTFDGEVGDIVDLQGYYTAGDGAHHKRKIASEDDGSGVQLANGLFANIVKDVDGYKKSWFGFEKCNDLWFKMVDRINAAGEKPTNNEDPFVNTHNSKYLILDVDKNTNYFKSKFTENYNVNYARIYSVNTIDENRVGINCFGDSITFGMYSHGGDEVVKIGQPTNFGDGSVYAHNQVGTPFPQHLENTLNYSVFKGLGGFTVNNFGFSGDRSSNGYFRHSKNNTKKGFSIISYGTNDFLFCTSNGVNNTDIYNINSTYNINDFTLFMKLWVFREVERGNVPVLLAPNTQFTTAGQSLFLKSYNRALKAISEELGVLLLYVDDMMSGVPRIDVHLSSNEYSAIGNRLASLFIGGGYKDIPVLKEGYNSGLVQFVSNLNIPSLKTVEKIHALIGNNLSRPDYEAIVSADFLSFSFFVESDVCYLFPLTSIRDPQNIVEVFANNKPISQNREFMRYDRSLKLKSEYSQVGSQKEFSNIPEYGNYIELTRGLNHITVRKNQGETIYLQGFYVCSSDEFLNNSDFIPAMTSMNTPSGEVYGTASYIGIPETRFNCFDKDPLNDSTYENNKLPIIGYKSVKSCKPKGYILTNYNNDQARVEQCIKSWDIVGIMYGGVEVLLDKRDNINWQLGQDSKVFYFRKQVLIEAIELRARAINGSTYARLTEFEIFV